MLSHSRLERAGREGAQRYLQEHVWFAEPSVGEGFGFRSGCHFVVSVVDDCGGRLPWPSPRRERATWMQGKDVVMS